MPKVHNRHHKTAPADAIYIGRGSPWGNPFIGGTHGTRDEVCNKFEQEVLPHLDLEPLRGKDLVCSCKPRRCHGDSILAALEASWSCPMIEEDKSCSLGDDFCFCLKQWGARK